MQSKSRGTYKYNLFPDLKMMESASLIDWYISEKNRSHSVITSNIKYLTKCQIYLQDLKGLVIFDLLSLYITRI